MLGVMNLCDSVCLFNPPVLEVVATTAVREFCIIYLFPGAEKRHYQHVKMPGHYT